jgi:hypothetical protein
MKSRKLRLSPILKKRFKCLRSKFFSQGVNVALQATAIQSSTSTFVSGSGATFDASNAIDGDDSTFSHTRDSSSWWEVDLGGLYSVESINIKNRWCKNPSDPDGCLCKLSHATVSLVDGNGALIASALTNNTCGVLNVHLPDLNPSCTINVPSSSPASATSCLPITRKVKLHQASTDKTVQIFELEVFSSSTGTNIAVGKTATQSSTFLTKSGEYFDAFYAIDGDTNTFSHTKDSNSWIEVDLGNSFPVNTITILNRWCGNSNDPKGCLCKLTGATLSLIDDSETEITSTTIGDTCGQSTLEYVFDPSPDFCPTSSVSFLSNRSEHISILFYVI